MRTTMRTRERQESERGSAAVRTITGVLVDPLHGFAGSCTIRKSLESYYELLECRVVDITRRAVEGKPFEFVLDDEGALKPDALISAIDTDGQPMLFGKLFIAGYDGGEDLKSLDSREITLIMSNLRHYFVTMHDGKVVSGIAVECSYA